MTTHLVHGGETLQSIAARYYGTSSRWHEIAVANNLRPPYIATDILQTLGPLLVRVPLASDAPAGATSITLAPFALDRVGPGTRVALIRLDPATGQRLLVIQSVRAVGATVITLDAPLTQRYSTGTPVLVYPAATEVRGQVALPGSTLLIPIDTGGTSGTLALVDDRFGRDIASDDTGQLVFTATGDLLIRSGIDNLHQQLTNRLRCEQGALTRHPGYGNTVYTYLGQANGPTLGLLVQAALARCLADDPRVSGVDQVSVTQTADTISAQARVQARTESVDLRLQVSS